MDVLVDNPSTGDLATYRSPTRRRQITTPLLKQGLAVGRIDRQGIHREDELYVVLRGQATLTVAGEQRRVGPGSAVYVAAGVEHRFHSVTDDLEVLVVFAPAESTGPLLTVD